MKNKLYWTAVMSVAFSLLAGAAVARGTFASASDVKYLPVNGTNVTLSDPMAPARLGEPEALAIAEGGMNPSLFTHPFTVTYGAFTDNSYYQRTGGPSGSFVPVGTRDVWRVMITGLNLSRPCAVTERPESCPPIHTWVIFVDDASGKVLEGIGY